MALNYTVRFWKCWIFLLFMHGSTCYATSMENCTILPHLVSLLSYNHSTSPVLKVHLLAVQPDWHNWCMYPLFHTAGIYISVTGNNKAQKRHSFTHISKQCKYAHGTIALQIHTLNLSVVLKNTSEYKVKGRALHMCFSARLDY